MVLSENPIMRTANRWCNWFRRFLSVDRYEFRGDEIVGVRTGQPIVKIPEIASWQQIFIDFGVSVIFVKFANGQADEFSDSHEELFCILRKIAPERELPFAAV